MNTIKALVRDWTPPIFRRTVKNVFFPGIRFTGDYSNWEEAKKQCLGYDAGHILNKVLEATLKVKRGEAAYERDSVVFSEIEYAWPVAAGLMWVAAQTRGRLDVLDFGGALGSSYFQNHIFLSRLPQVQWSVIEQSHYVSAGNKHIADETLKFYEKIDDCILERRPNVVLLSNVLQYLPDPFELIKKICLIQANFIILDRTIVNRFSNNKIYVQSVPSSIYAATYPCRSFAEMSLLEAFRPSYKLELKFPSLDFSALNSISADFNGYIFSKVLE